MQFYPEASLAEARKSIRRALPSTSQRERIDLSTVRGHWIRLPTGRDPSRVAGSRREISCLDSRRCFLNGDRLIDPKFGAIITLEIAPRPRRRRAYPNSKNERGQTMDRSVPLDRLPDGLTFHGRHG